MSDSDNELLSNNVFTLQNNSTIVCARGPNTNTSTISLGQNNRNALTSTMHMPRNFERQRYAESNYDQRSNRRETSPMSVMSACDMRQRNFNNSYYQRARSSQRSGFHGRSGSPMSVRSIDSTASVSASDIAMALKNMNYNKYDVRIIAEAYNKFMKHRVRKKIEKRRNLRLFLKGSRHRSGDDSGEQGSDSSLSSDDSRPTRTSNYKENMSSCRSTKTDFSDFRRTIQESNMYTDCTDNFRQNSFRRMVGGPANLNNTQASVSSFKSMMPSMPPPANFNNMQSKPNVPFMPQRERFKNGFLLPSQRFNQSVASSTIPENAEKITTQRKNLPIARNDVLTRSTVRNCETDSDQDDIFSDRNKQKTSNTNNVQRKRCLDSVNDMCLPIQKRTKIASPCKNSKEAREVIPTSTSNNNDKENDFVFAKPILPVKKSTSVKTKEKLISKSAAPLSDTIIQPVTICNIPKPQPNELEEDKQKNDDVTSDVTKNSTDLSMRPSFIKRKLFSQKIDTTDVNNVSLENSPQHSIYSAIQKEKHKARKLQQVTTQSCMSRDLQQDESNVLDLIQKIVPVNSMNVTNQTNRTELQSSRNKTEEDDKWDVTSIISTRNADNDSDTYTDEEIFNATVKEATKENVKGKTNVSKKPASIKSSTMLVEKLPNNNNNTLGTKSTVQKSGGTSTKTVQKFIKSFWDTDFESDEECQPPRSRELKESNTQQKEVPKFKGFENMFNTSKLTTKANANVSTFFKNTVDTIQKFNNTSLRIRSHRTPKKKKLDQSRDDDARSEYFEPQSKKQKTHQAADLSKPESKSKVETENKNSKSKTITTLNKGNKKPPESKKPVSTTDEQNESVQSLRPPKNIKTYRAVDLIQSKPKSKVETENNNSNTKSPLHKVNKKPPESKKQVLKNDKQIESVECPNQSSTKKQISIKNQESFENEQPKQKRAYNKKRDLVENEQLNKKQSNKKQNTFESQRSNQTSSSNQKQNESIQSMKPPTKNSKNSKKQVSLEKQHPKQNRANNKNQDQVVNEEINNRQNNKKQVTTQADIETKKQNKNVKKPVKLETDSKIKKTSPKNIKTNNTTLRSNSTLKEDIITEENNNKRYRAVRSCRNSKNSTLDQSNHTLNGTIIRTLRSRQIDLSATNNGNTTKSTKTPNNIKVSSKDTNARLSDVSFSLLADKNVTNRKAVVKLARCHLLHNNAETSDVSFSLIQNDSPKRRNEAVSAKSRTNSKCCKNNNIRAKKCTPIKKNIQSKQLFVSKNDSKPVRNKTPNKRYLVC